MRKLGFLIIALLASNVYGQLGVTEKLSFYEYKKSGQLLNKLQNMLVTSEPGFSYGFHSYNQKEIENTVCFFNQPSNTLHYVLTNKDNHTLHFQIPILELDHINQVNGTYKDKQFVEFVYKDQSEMKVKEHTSDGNIIFSLKYTAYQLPLSNAVDVGKLSKLIGKILVKADNYQVNDVN